MKKHSHPKTSSINNFLPICFFAVSSNQNSMSWLHENHWISRKSRGKNGWFAKFLNFWWFLSFWTCDFGTYTQRGKKHGSSLTLTNSKHQKTTKNYPILNHKTWFLAIFAKPNCISFQKPSNDLKNDSKMMFKNDLSMNSPEKPWHQKSLPCAWNQGSPNSSSVLFGLFRSKSAVRIRDRGMVHLGRI